MSDNDDPIRFGENAGYGGGSPALLCPGCGHDYTHVDQVVAHARPSGETGPVLGVMLGANGLVQQGVSVPGNTARRHSFGLVGTCEECRGAFIVEFEQHKGQTSVRSRMLQDEEYRALVRQSPITNAIPCLCGNCPKGTK